MQIKSKPSIKGYSRLLAQGTLSHSQEMRGAIDSITRERKSLELDIGRFRLTITELDAQIIANWFGYKKGL